MKNAAYLTGVALVAAALGYGIYQYAVDRPETTAPAAAPASADLPALLPDFTLRDLQGELRSIRSWPGQSMIVNFWATWCAPCRREIPLLNALHQQYSAEGFQVVGVAVDFREDVERFAQEFAIQYPLLIGEQDALEAIDQFGLGTLGFPFTVLTDHQHRIVLFHLGEIEPAQAEVMLAAVKRVNRGELTPQAARRLAAQQLAALPGPQTEP